MAALPFPLLIAEKAMQEFVRRWLAGMEPQLFLETNQDGIISINSSVKTSSKLQQHVLELDPMPQLHPYLLHQCKSSPSRLRRRKRREMRKKTIEALDKSTNTEEIDDENVVEKTPVLNYTNLSQVPLNYLWEYEELQHRNPGATEQTESQDQDLESSLNKTSVVFKYKPTIDDELNGSQSRYNLASAESRKYKQCDKEMYDYLEEQKRQKDLEIQKLTNKMTLGFTPMKPKKPF